MLYFVILALSEDLDDQLVQGVVIALAQFDGVPGISAFHLPLQARFLGLFAVGFLFGGVFHLEQQPVLLECQNRRTLLISHNWMQSYEIILYLCTQIERNETDIIDK